MIAVERYRNTEGRCVKWVERPDVSFYIINKIGIAGVIGIC